MLERAKLDLVVGGSLKTIQFGIAETQQEKREVYRLRYKIYSERGYIQPASLPNQIEDDLFDERQDTTHFIAKLGDKLIGTVRVIRSPNLPIRDFFKFTNPQIVEKLSQNKQCEISRLIIDKYSETEYLPRNVVLLVLIHVLVEFCREENIEIALAFIKDKLHSKLKRLNIPFHMIEPFTCTYPQNGTMWNYFYDDTDKAYPSYFDFDALERFVDEMLERRNIFTKVGSDHFVLKDNLYTEFLMFLKII